MNLEKEVISPLSIFKSIWESKRGTSWNLIASGQLISILNENANQKVYLQPYKRMMESEKFASFQENQQYRQNNNNCCHEQTPGYEKKMCRQAPRTWKNFTFYVKELVYRARNTLQRVSNHTSSFLYCLSCPVIHVASPNGSSWSELLHGLDRLTKVVTEYLVCREHFFSKTFNLQQPDQYRSIFNTL